MKAFFIINTPGQAHTWSHVIGSLRDKGHEVHILARNYGSTPELLSKYGLEYSLFNPIKSKYMKAFGIFAHILKGYRLSQEHNPDIIIGFGIDAAFTAALFRKPCIVFTDGEPIPIQNFLIKLFSDAILTPACFRKDLGKKHVRFAGYKELAYLHPNYFRPDPSIYDDLGINKDEKYVILRFNAFDAVHDIGRHGFSLPDKYRLVNELSKYAYVFISAEGSLPQNLRSYKLPIPSDRIHHAL